MNGFIDLHTHSSASDGSMAPEELIKHAYNKGLKAIALTDHDTIDGIDRALKKASEIGLELIPGVEISVDFEPEMHILGYFKADNYRNILKVLDELRQKRDERNPKMVEKLNRLGFDITMDEVAGEAGGNIVARPHMASILVKKGYARSIQDAFAKFLGDGKAAFVKKSKLTCEQGINAINEAGGLACLAHPIHLGFNTRKLDRLLGELKSMGLKGIEAIYVDNTKDDTGNLLRLAIKHELLVTGGSDFHGSFKPDIEIGIGRGNLSVEYSCLEKLKVALI